MKKAADDNGISGKLCAFSIWHILSAFLFNVLVTSFAFSSFGGSFTPAEPCLPDVNTPASISSRPVAKIAPEPSSSEIRSLHQLLALSPAELEKVDIGLMNLLCAQGLKGAENLDIEKCLATLDEWAEIVRFNTQIRRNLLKRFPQLYNNSEAFWRMYMLVIALKEELGIHYNIENMRTPDYSDSSQIFIHGLLGLKREGSCTSLPVLCVAVGRRLGYPVKLVRTSSHTFVRWEDEKTGKRFNIEPSNELVASYDDEYYKEWPERLTDFQLKSGYYLKSLTAAEEFSTFLSYRGKSLTDIGKTAEAQIAFAYSYYFSPEYVNNLLPLAAATENEMQKLWKKDCELEGSNRVHYFHFDGFTRDPKEMTYEYPHFPPKGFLEETAKKNNMTPQDLLYETLFKITAPVRQQRIVYIPEPPLQYGQNYSHNPHLNGQQTQSVSPQTPPRSMSVSDITSDIVNKMMNNGGIKTERDKR